MWYTLTMGLKDEKRASTEELEVLRDLLLERGFTMEQVRRAVRALTPSAVSFTKEQVRGTKNYVGWPPLMDYALRIQRTRDRGVTYKGDLSDDIPFPKK